MSFSREDDLTLHARPDADGEALVDGLAYLLLVLDLVALGDERRGRLQQTAAEGQVDAGDLADQGDDAFLGDSVSDAAYSLPCLPWGSKKRALVIRRT